MTTSYRSFALMLMVTILAAGLAGWLGVSYGLKQSPPDLDHLLHEKLDLTSSQEQRIGALESEMDANRAVLRKRMMEANRELSAALTHDHAFGPPEQAATEHFHEAMMELQQDTIKHVMAMRAVLNPDQARRFDAIITKSLTKASP